MAVPRSPDAIDVDQAATIFAEFAVAVDLALRFPADGCYARAHLMVQRLLARGLTPLKMWAFAASTEDLLWIETTDHAGGRVQWGYHVAPVLIVQAVNGEGREMVFDPILFAEPVAVDDWCSALHDPLPARGGSGYWPADQATVAYKALNDRKPGGAITCPYCQGAVEYDVNEEDLVQSSRSPLRFSRAKMETRAQSYGQVFLNQAQTTPEEWLERDKGMPRALRGYRYAEDP